MHYLLACALTVSGKQLPKWGYEQQEVACNPNLRDPSAVWNVEENIFPKCKKLHFNGLWNILSNILISFSTKCKL